MNEEPVLAAGADSHLVPALPLLRCITWPGYLLSFHIIVDRSLKVHTEHLRSNLNLNQHVII